MGGLFEVVPSNSRSPRAPFSLDLVGIAVVFDPPILLYFQGIKDLILVYPNPLPVYFHFIP